MPDTDALPLVILNITITPRALGTNETAMARALATYRGMQIKQRLTEFLENELDGVDGLALFSVHVTDDD